jgi:hypothetical protein
VEMMGKIYVIHENSEWTVHLTKRLDELQLPYEEFVFGDKLRKEELKRKKKNKNNKRKGKREEEKKKYII